MKKLTIFLLLFISISCYSQLKFKTSFEFGYFNAAHRIKNIEYKEQLDFYYPKLSFYSNINLKFSFKKLNFETDILNIFTKNKIRFDNFSPLTIDYKTNLYYKFKTFNIGWFHNCIHPVLNSYDNSVQYFSYTDKIYFKIDINNL